MVFTNIFDEYYNSYLDRQTLVMPDNKLLLPFDWNYTY